MGVRRMIDANLKGISSMKLHRDLNITLSAAWAAASARLEPGREEFLSGAVEVDETYVGGKERLEEDVRSRIAGRREGARRQGCARPLGGEPDAGCANLSSKTMRMRTAHGAHTNGMLDYGLGLRREFVASLYLRRADTGT